MDLGILWNRYGATCPECFTTWRRNTHNGVRNGCNLYGRGLTKNDDIYRYIACVLKHGLGHSLEYNVGMVLHVLNASKAADVTHIKVSREVCDLYGRGLIRY